jgi:hypothetical protein
MIKFTEEASTLNLLTFSNMSGFYGVVSKKDCVKDVFYGTKRPGMVFIVPQKGFRNSKCII